MRLPRFRLLLPIACLAPALSAPRVDVLRTAADTRGVDRLRTLRSDIVRRDARRGVTAPTDTVHTHTTRADTTRPDTTRPDTTRPDTTRGRGVPPDTARRLAIPGLRVRLRGDTLSLPLPPALVVGDLAPARSADAIVRAQAAALERAAMAARAALWGQTAAAAFDAAESPARGVDLTALPLPPTIPPAPPAADLLGRYGDLALQLRARVELKGERNRNQRCGASDLLNPVANCAGVFQPQFGVQFAAKSAGVVAERVQVGVDYDSQREFDASNRLSVSYAGKPGEALERVDLGNVSFTPPASRFITANVPSTNYGAMAVARLGAVTVRALYAQQKGNVVQGRVFTVGDRAAQSTALEVEDYQLERRRFFWVVDPRRAFPEAYPNVDILDRALGARARLATGERPRRVLVYRYRPPTAGGSVTRDINGPVAVTRGARTRTEIGPYEVLRQGVDYYLDPSSLWIALVNPVNQGERLAVSYTVAGPGGVEQVVGAVGGTVPTQRGAAGADTVNLLWDSELLPGDSAFDREIRSVYRLGGDRVQRATVSLKIVVGSGSDQERPVNTPFASYLEMFGLAQRTSPSTFDATNRLWPRVGDANVAIGANGTAAPLIRELFVVFPSLQPFASGGLARPPNPANDSLYRTPDDQLNTPQRPPTQYRLRVRYESLNGGDPGSLALGAVQLRPGSERLTVDGIPLRRGVDYRVDYELGVVTFARPDTLFPRPRQVAVEYEETPVFATTPTALFGLTSRLPLDNGELTFTALSQSQRSPFTRPPLGFEPLSATIAGVTGNFTWPADALTRALGRLPFVRTTAPSAVTLQGEFATSRPRAAGSGTAYIESFEGEGGIRIPLQDGAWRLGSQPAVRGGGIAPDAPPYAFPLDSATTLAWQNLGTVADSITGRTRIVQYYSAQIDTQFVFAGAQAFRIPETVLWTTLYPRAQGGLRDASGVERWRLPGGAGRRWRSISQSLSPSGADLTRVEQLEFWALVDTSLVRRRANPTVVLDFGDVSENTVAFAPETLTVRTRTFTDERGTVVTVTDTSYAGRRLAGYDRLDSERDPITRVFDAAVNDIGIPPSRLDSVIVAQRDSGLFGLRTNVPICSRGLAVLPLGDARTNCSRGNRRLDEEDLDLDGALNFSSAQRNDERLRRYVVNLADRAAFTRVGRCYHSAVDTSTTSAENRTVCWVQVRLPFATPTATLGDPVLRRVKSVRLTVLTNPATPPDAFVTLPIARLRLVGSPWLRRADRALAGIGGDAPVASGPVIASVIGTQDYNPPGGVYYQSPPGVTDAPDTREGEFAPAQVQINERSLRLLASDLPLYARAEAYYRFPQGERSFIGYQELRLWARGRNKGWGPRGDLQLFVRLGRDQNNFYLYRTPVNVGNTRDAWLPEVRVDFRRFFLLRAALQTAFLRGGESFACTGLDSLLVARSAPPAAAGARRYVACDSGYIAYAANPALTPPNLAAVQELAVGIVRTDTLGLGPGGGITATDTLELWVDDIRLGGVVSEPGYAGELALSVAAADVGTLRVSASRRDGNFRQLTEQPSFITDNQLTLASSLRLEKLLPQSLGLILPLTVSYARSGSDPTFLSRSDVPALGVAGLRRPRAVSTAYSLSVRRATPLASPLWGALLNDLAVTASYASSRSQQEYEAGRSSALSTVVDYRLPIAPRTVGAPGWLRALAARLPAWLRGGSMGRAVSAGALRWTPAELRITSGYARSSDARAVYALPIALRSDSARRVAGLTSLWRNDVALAFRPASGITLRWDLSSVRDLRDYGDSTTLAAAAARTGGRVLGLDAGFERERRMTTVLGATLPVASWLRPRFDVATGYGMLRDPNASLFVPGDAVAESGTLPARLDNSLALGAGATVDVARGVALALGAGSPVARLAAALQPVEIAWRRDLRSTYDNVPFTPGLGYQLPLGGLDAMRTLRGTPATGAADVRALSLAHTVSLPLGLTVVNRYARAAASSYMRVLDAQAPVEARERTFPDVSLRWSWQPPLLRNVITSVAGQAGARVTRATTAQLARPAGGDGLDLAVRTAQTTREYPVNGSITWAPAGGFSTSAGWNRTDRTELRSGGVTVGQQRDVSAEVAKAFPLPASWGWRGNQLRARAGFQRSAARSWFESDGGRRRITDNGRWAVNANADSDVSEVLSLSVTLAHSITFDNNFGRRYSQTLVSAVLHLTFFAGALQ